MSLFGLSKTADRYGVIIDIGSGSVLTAIVHSSPKNKHPNIVWAHREHAPLRNVDSLEQSAKAVMTALVNSSIRLDAEGRKELFDYNKNATLTEFQCSIAAPWSYTVTKTINYKQEDSFTITEELLEELVNTINEKTESDLAANEALQDLGLEVVTRATMDILSNGYRVENPEGQRAETLTLSRTSVVTQRYLIEAVNEMHDKLFPETKAGKLSFILMLYAMTRKLLHQTYDACLIDITYEATEIGVVRDGVLSYCTHTPFGTFSLAREISSVTKIPLHEAFGYLHTELPYRFIKTLPSEQQKQIELVFEAYIDRVSKLFHETGDALSIPKQISLHSDLNSETLFLDLIEKAAKRSTKSEPDITAISAKILQATYEKIDASVRQQLPKDTALLLSTQFFHDQLCAHSFEYL
jgi:cell division ATPase FtsA